MRKNKNILKLIYMSSIDFSNFIENCQTGDLLLFSSNAIYSRLIELLSFSKFSHIAYIIKNPTWLHPDLSGVYLFESGAEPTVDVLSKHKVFGVQLTPIEEIYKDYKNSYCGYLYYVKNDFDRTEDYYSKLKEILIKTDGEKYDLDPIDWIKARFDINVGQRKINSFFCSALVGFILESVGQIHNDVDWTYVSPRRYSVNSSDALQFINCIINPEIYIKL